MQAEFLTVRSRMLANVADDPIAPRSKKLYAIPAF